MSASYPEEIKQMLPRFAGGGLGDAAYLPLELWRDEAAAAALFAGSEVSRVFRSSGTTGGARSLSRFSVAGLAAYKAQSTAYFRQVLAQVLPAGEIASAQGLSLVPSVDEWGDSSLAQMVAWLGEVLPLRYVRTEDLRQAVQAAAEAGRCVWVFGTALHLIQTLEAGQGCPLPPGSVVIETGGTKGQRREISRDVFYQQLAAGFGVPETALISEYGMCELACQAYDYVPRGQQVAAAGREFLFGPDVIVAAMTGPGEVAATGRGALVVVDPLRVDFPWALRTEDLVEIAESATGTGDKIACGRGFKLLGRAPRAPLKGCSLRAEAVFASANESEASVEAAETATDTSSASELRWSERAAEKPLAEGSPRKHLVTTKSSAEAVATAEASQVRRTTEWDAGFDLRLDGMVLLIEGMLARGEVARLLGDEVGSLAAGEAAARDLHRGLPKSRAAWKAAVTLATSGAGAAKRWLFILPDNHALVGIYPLAIAYLAGLEVSVRLPRRFAAGANLLTAFCAALGQLPGAELRCLGPELRFGAGLNATQFDAVLCYGSDETLTTLRSQLNIPVRGFGHRIGVSLLGAADFAVNAPALALDSFGLGQTGCMASRLALVVDPKNDFDIVAGVHTLQGAASAFWQADLPWLDRVGLDFEAWRLRRVGCQIWLPAAANELKQASGGTALTMPLIATRRIDASAVDFSADVAPLIAQAPFTASMLILAGAAAGTAAVEVCRRMADLGSLGAVGLTASAISAEPNPAGFGDLAELRHLAEECRGARILGLGDAQAPCWDGSHENTPLFNLSAQKSPTFKLPSMLA